jgi:hypothetical protein
MTAPYTEFLRSLKPTDTENEKLRKLLRAYGQSGGFRAVRKDRGSGAVFAKIFGVADDEGDDGEQSDDNETAASKQHFVSTLADLLVEGSEGAFSRESALSYLMRSAHGAALVRRLHHQKRLQKKETKTMTHNRAEELSAIAKQYGIAAIAKKVVDDGPGGISEHEMTKLITEAAQRAWPGLTPAAAFAKIFCGDELLRRAVNACKTFDVQPPQLLVAPAVVGGEAAEDVDNATDALAALERLATALRRQYPELTREKAFAKVYTDPANRALAAAERRQNRPVA